MAAYQSSNEMAGSAQSLTSTAKSILAVNAVTATLTRAAVQDILVGASNVPNATDCSINYDVVRVTTSGTSTAVTPSPLDSTVRAAGCTAWANATAEPTTGVYLLSLALNQRASQRWVAAPGSELIVPATNLAGVGLRARSTNYASTVICAMISIE
jgi:hypothetical protein